MASIEIIPTCVPANADELSQAARGIKAYASTIHIDITDGVFAAACTWPYQHKGVHGSPELSGAHGLEVEMHLMVRDPRALGSAFARAGAFRILGHVEAFADESAAHQAMHEWRESGAREAGLGVLMQTPFERVSPLVPACDAVHLMTIARIGTQGIPYEESAPAHVSAFHALHPETLISVDGGVSKKNIEALARAGARRFGVGSAISLAPDPAASYAELMSLAQGALL